MNCILKIVPVSKVSGNKAPAIYIDADNNQRNYVNLGIEAAKELSRLSDFSQWKFILYKEILIRKKAKNE